MEISRIVKSDFDNVLELNASSVPHVNLIDAEQLQWFVEHAAFAATAKIDGTFGGFMIGLRPGTRYGSENYRWFVESFEDFAYIDRIAVSPWARRRGVAEKLYQAFERSQPGVPRLTCEVNIKPPNVASTDFHTRLGFRRVGSISSSDGSKQVALMEKPL